MNVERDEANGFVPFVVQGWGQRSLPECKFGLATRDAQR